MKFSSILNIFICVFRRKTTGLYVYAYQSVEYVNGFYFNNYKPYVSLYNLLTAMQPGLVAQSVGHRTRKSGVLGSIPGLATYFRFSFRFFKKGSCQLLAKVCARRRSKAAQEKCG